jgi:hypothetical protein
VLGDLRRGSGLNVGDLMAAVVEVAPGLACAAAGCDSMRKRPEVREASMMPTTIAATTPRRPATA